MESGDGGARSQRRAEIVTIQKAPGRAHGAHYAPPPNFAKETDTRYDAYVRKFGTTDCWELDALSPTVISDLIRDEITELIDESKWKSALTMEKRNRGLLHRAAENWSKVEKLLKG